MLEAILFDMDGTLVPMDTDTFTKGYFKLLCKKLAPLNMNPNDVVASIWNGTKKMILNDGSKYNEDVFWESFTSDTGKLKEEVNPYCLDFYSNEFKEGIIFTSPNELAKKAVELAHIKASKVILSSNPVFPKVGQITRCGYVGLTESDFDLITAYETDRFCKPNPKFFEDVCKRACVNPENCLVIGNDLKEDIWCAKQLGMKTYLVTDCLIDYPKYNYDGPKGTFEELIKYLEEL